MDVIDILVTGHYKVNGIGWFLLRALDALDKCNEKLTVINHQLKIKHVKGIRKQFD